MCQSLAAVVPHVVEATLDATLAFSVSRLNESDGEDKMTDDGV